MNFYRKKLKNSAGVTLVELMIAVAIFGIVAIGLAGTFASVAKAIQFSKSKGLAANLCQEQMQILKQKAFNKILVTTSSANIPLISPSIPYDTGYYPPESITEGSIQFTRYTYIQVADENSGALNYYSAVPDTGMKAIRVIVTWNYGTEVKKVEMRNIIANIDTTMTNCVVYGTVTSNLGGGIPYAQVTLAENPGYTDTANATGAYTINLSPGSYWMVASADGYYSSYRNISIAANQSQPQPFTLTRISTGTIRGTAWLNDHLVLCQVVGRYDNTFGEEQEWVMVFNPTTFTWTMNGQYGIKYQRPGAAKLAIDITYVNNTVPPGGFYLFANMATISVFGVSTSADAVWNSSVGGFNDLNFTYFAPPGNLNIIASRAEGGSEGAGAVELYRVSDGQPLDQLGWTRTIDALAAPFYEGTALNESTGLEVQEQYVRFSSTSGASTTLGPAYDSGNNNVDWTRINPLTMGPKNSASATQLVVAGVPAIGAYVSAVDGVSDVSTATATGAVPYAEFRLLNVATGTWTVYITSNTYYTQISSVSVVTNSTTSIPNASSSPTWVSNGYYSAKLNDVATQGYISGWVRNTIGQAISPAITVKAGGTSVLANTTNGIYFLALSSSTYDVTANPSNLSATYVSVTSQTVPVLLGQVASGVNFTLSQGGRIRGFVTRDGTNALPGINFVAFDSNEIVRDEEVSSSDGRFTLVNLATGTYRVEPILGSGETSTPSTATVTVTAGTTVTIATFTVTGSYGTIRGSVTDTSQAIRTGVLIVCSTAALPSGPPDLSASTLTGMAYYLTNSYEDGTYALDVRGSTSTTYRLYAYYTTFSGVTPNVSSRTVSGITVTAGQTTSNVNFSW